MNAQTAIGRVSPCTFQSLSPGSGEQASPEVTTRRGTTPAIACKFREIFYMEPYCACDSELKRYGPCTLRIY